MKRITLIAFMFICLLGVNAQTTVQQPEPMLFQVIPIDIKDQGVIRPRTPLNPPHAYLSGNVITLTSHADFEVEILQNDAIVYTDYLPSGTDTLQLPDSLSGEYEIRFYTDSFVFIGYFEI